MITDPMPRAERKRAEYDRSDALVQAIPFRREQWECTIAGWNVDEHRANYDALDANRHIYAETLWQRKSYG